jgi:glycosyltransferase involved in cell wall biosynthesis
MQVTYFFRKSQPQYHSIERVFDLVIKNLPDTIQPRVYKLRNGEKGIWSRIKALWEVRRNKGAINHITGDISYVAPALPKKGLVVTFHDLESLHRNSGVVSKLLKWFWVTIPARRASVITVISNHTKEQVMKWAGVPEEKIVVIPNPLPEGFGFLPKPEFSSPPVIMTVGTKSNKNLEGIIRAVDGMGCKLLMIGKLSEAQKELLKEKQLEYENLAGVTDQQIIEAYQRCDLLCFPSLFEGFGMPIIEAQATGIPVVTSNYGAMKEVAGDGALLVDPSDVQEIRHAVERIIGDDALRKRLIEAGRENARKYQPATVALKNVEVYEKL